MLPSPAEIKRILIVTDAWHPQVNGVVRTIMNTCSELEQMGCSVDMITPADYKTVPCPTYPEIRLSLAGSRGVEARIRALAPDAIHIATEGPLGWAARNACIRNKWRFTTAYHTRFPEYVHARTRLPVSWFYALFRTFHSPAEVMLAPTQAIIRTLVARGFSNVGFWSRGVDHQIFYPRVKQKPSNPHHPIWLYAGRLAVEKNIEAFLELDLPGEKWVAGEGPLEVSLKRRYKGIRWIGVVSQHELAELYSRADVFVFPSKTDTFGLVMVEAMACGLPVAAYPVEGPLDVIGDSRAGVMHSDLRRACMECLSIPRSEAIAHSQVFAWRRATEQFLAAHPHAGVVPSPAFALAPKGSV